jgi:hypothetical protein
MFTQDARALARALASMPGALRLQNPDGSVNRDALRRALARLEELESASADAMRVPMPGKSRHKGWRGLKSGTAGARSGHRGDDGDKRRAARRAATVRNHGS